MRTYARPIDVITSTDFSGQITPVRFRVDRKDGSQAVVSVDRVIDRIYERIAGEQTILFKCEAAGIKVLERRLQVDAFPSINHFW